MARFNWIEFLNKHNIDYVTHGPNVARDNVNIACPFCQNDPSHHLGIHPGSGVWGCWRDDSHRGRSPVRLIMKLIRCSYSQAIDIAGYADRVELSTFDEVVKGLSRQTTKSANISHKPLELHTTFREIDYTVALARPYFNYIRERGFSKSETYDVIERYNLKFALTGPWKHRIIIPVYDEDGKLMSWTGRALSRRAVVRYKALSDDPEFADENNLPCARANIRNLLFNIHRLYDKYYEMLYITEGPFDAIKLDYFLDHDRKMATCIFGALPTDAQFHTLKLSADFYKESKVLLDEGAELQAIKISNRFGLINAGFAHLPDGVDDPGDLTKSHIKRLF